MTLRFRLLGGSFAVARLDASATIPDWSNRGAFTSVTRTPEELSIVCDDDAVPADVRAERGWRALQLEGPIAFEMTGVAARFTAALAARAISVFVISTFDTDYLLVKATALDAAIAALRDDGSEVTDAPHAGR
ncbi:MAG: hypothetical protein JWO97_4859 [Acidobacteria bacterium]|nr:hypothetical protein [Acidobacteriota bacterium]